MEKRELKKQSAPSSMSPTDYGLSIRRTRTGESQRRTSERDAAADARRRKLIDLQAKNAKRTNELRDKR